MAHSVPRVFISYCHADMSKARKIEEDLGATGLEIVRDERALGYTEDIESYMKKIRATDYALILVSDAFLRSTNCMFEVHEFLKDENHRDRVLPVILKDYMDERVERKGARIYTPEGAADYVRYWQDREGALRKQLEGLDISNLTHFARELSLIQSITKTVADFMFLLRRIKHVNLDDLLNREYRDILEKVGYRGIGTGDVRRARSLYSQAIGQRDVAVVTPAGSTAGSPSGAAEMEGVVVKASTLEVAKRRDTVVFGQTVGDPIIAAALPALVIFGLYMSPMWEAGWAEWIHLDVSFPLPAIGAMVALGFLYLIAAIVDFLPVAAVAGLLTVMAFIVGFTKKAGEYSNIVWQNAGMEGLAPIVDIPLWLVLSLVAFPIIWACITMKEHKKRSGNGVAFSLSVLAVAFFVPALWRAIFA